MSTYKIKLEGDINEVKRLARQCIAPPTKVPNHRETAKDIKFPDGPKMGETYDPTLDPVHAFVTQELDNPRWNRFVWVGAVQTGKSLLLMLTILRALCHLFQSVVYSQPTGPKINEAWTGKLQPIIETSAFRTWMPQKGQGSKGSQSLSFLLFRNPKTNARAGMLYGIPGGGKSEAAQAAVTAPVIANDEVDSYKDRHRVELIAKRADSFGKRAKRIYTSTVKKDQDSIILGLYNDSTRSRLWFKCPHCPPSTNAWQPMEWEQVVYDSTDELTAMESVRYVCKHNACRISEDDRLHMLSEWKGVHDGQTVDEKGTVSGLIPRTTTFGLLWSGLDSTIRSMPMLASEHYRAAKSMEAGDHGPMRSFYRDQLCREYTGELEELETAGLITWQHLQRRTIGEKWGPTRPISDRDPSRPQEFLYSRHVAPTPNDAENSVLTVDVQHNRVYWLLRAFNRIGTSWLVGWGYEYGRADHEPTDKQETKALLNRVWSAVKGYAGHADIVVAGLDVGDNTETLREWVNETGSPWRAMKGYTHHMKAEEFDVEGLAYWRDGIILMQADAARDLFHVTLRRPLNADGATHFPYGIGMQDIYIFRHLVSEQTGIDPDTKKRIIIRGSGRNDFLDCAKMSETLIVGYLMELKSTEGKVPAPIKTKQPANPDDGPSGAVRVQPSTLSVSRATNRPHDSPLFRTNRRQGIFRRDR